MKHITAFMLFLAVIVFSTVAFADAIVTATADGYAIKAQDGMQTVISFLFAAVAGLAGAVSTFLFGPKGKLPLDTQQKLYIDSLIASGLALGETRLRGVVGNIKDPMIQNHLVATAVNFVLTYAPTILAKYEITPVKLRQLVLEKLEHAEGEYKPLAAQPEEKTNA